MTQHNRQEPQKISQLMILVSFTALAAGLVAETLLMGWEGWAVPLIIGAVGTAWLVHIRQKMNPHQRIWIYTVLMMGCFFFYGVHVTSTYDMAALMMLVMILYTVTGEKKLVSFCQLTYYITMLYDILQMNRMGAVWDSLTVSRTAMHILLVTMAGWVSRFIIDEWARMFRASDRRIEALDETARRMNVFMANLSHELRTPVNAIKGMAEVMQERLPSAEQEHLRTIRGATDRMAAQVSDIMAYSELETGRLVVNAEPYTLSSLMNDVVQALKPRMISGVELVIDVDPTVPAEMVSDARMLKKVLFHLIGNGLKFTREGGVYVHVTAPLQDYGVNLCVEVRDTGIGMNPAELDQVFNRFYQTAGGKAVSAGGLGLGLPIACGFVRALGGFMMIDSDPGKGTSVRVSVPQRVTDGQNCMSLKDPGALNLAGFLNIRKFQNPYVREFYNAMILNAVHGLGATMHRVDNLEDLKKLDAGLRLTHLFVGVEEYQSAPDYLEGLAGRMKVILVAPEDFRLPAGSRMSRLDKPLYSFPLVEALNAEVHQQEPGNLRMVCPGVSALVVDDEPMNLTVADSILRRYGMNVTRAASGAEALRLCREKSFDIVFMDHMMPEMDGVETMKRLRRLTHGADLPIVALTANALSSAREMFMNEGFDGFVSKPIELPELERVLKRLLPRGRVDYVTEAPAPAEPAAPAPDAAAPADTLQPLLAAGVHLESGRRYCQGDEELYRSLLQQFAADGPDKRRRMADDIADENWQDYAIAVHSLKSTSRTLGADGLYESARALETAARAGRGEAVRAGHEALVRGWQALEDAIRACPGLTVPRSAESAQASGIVLEFLPEGGDDA